MDDGSVAVVQTVLEPGERLLWSRHPVPDTGYRPLNWLAALFCAGFAIAPVYLSSRNGFEPVALVFTAAGVAFLAWIVWGPRLVARTVYAVTDRRVLILHRAIWQRVEEYALREMAPTNVQVTRRREGRGTVGFADFAHRCAYDKNEICMPEMSAVPDPDGVAELIRRAIEAARRVPTTAWGDWGDRHDPGG